MIVATCLFADDGDAADVDVCHSVDALYSADSPEGPRSDELQSTEPNCTKQLCH